MPRPLELRVSQSPEPRDVDFCRPYYPAARLDASLNIDRVTSLEAPSSIDLHHLPPSVTTQSHPIVKKQPKDSSFSVHLAAMIEPMDVFKKVPAIPTAVPTPTPIGTVLPEPDKIYQTAGTTGTNALW